MKRFSVFLPICLLSTFFISSCGNSSSTSSDQSSELPSGDFEETYVSIPEDTISSSFSLTDSSGNKVTPINNVYTISEGGIYNAKGKLDFGQIYIDASETDVEIDMYGASIANDSVSPIFVKTCKNFSLKSVNNFTNYVYDTRTTDCSSSSNGTAAIYSSDGDIEIKGKGTIGILSLYNNGIHSKDNVSIKNVSMNIVALNNAIKGKDKVTIKESATTYLVAGNRGVVTTSSSLGSKTQHGSVFIKGGTTTIHSKGDAIKAAYEIDILEEIGSDDTKYIPNLTIFTGQYSTYFDGSNIRPHGDNEWGNEVPLFTKSSPEKDDDSTKGLEASEGIVIEGGTTNIKSIDNSLHTKIEVLDNGNTSSGLVSITGGTLNVYTMNDGIHSNGSISIEGGTLNVISAHDDGIHSADCFEIIEGLVNVFDAHEGLEAHKIAIDGGSIFINATDDGVNAVSVGNGTKNGSIIVNGGRIDVTVPPNGDFDGIDSNGSIQINGGIVIARGPDDRSGNMSPLDADGDIRISGGTVIVIGNCKVNSTSLVKTESSNGLNAGKHLISINGNVIQYSNSYDYSGKTTVFSKDKADIQ